MSTHKQGTPFHLSIPHSSTKHIISVFPNPPVSLYPSLPTEIIDSILGYLCLLQAESAVSAASLALSSIQSGQQAGNETPLPPLQSLRRPASPTVVLLPLLLVNSYFNRLAQRRLYAAVLTRGVKRCVMFMQTLLRTSKREKKFERSGGENAGHTITGSRGSGGGAKDRDTGRSYPLLLVKSIKLDISGEVGVLGGFYNLLHSLLLAFATLSTSISLTELHLDFPETHSPSSVLEDCAPLLKRLKVFSTSMHCQRPLARALEEMDELRELTLRGFQREVDRSVFPVVGAEDNWSSDGEETASEDDLDDDYNDGDYNMSEEDEYDWREFPRSVSGDESRRREAARRPTRAFYLPRKSLKNLRVFNAIHSRPGIIREVLRGRDVKVVSVPVFSGTGIQTLDAVARAGKKREAERRKRRDSRKSTANGKEREMEEGDSESMTTPLPPPSVRRLSIISFDPDSPAYLLPELVKRFGTPGWDLRFAPSTTRSHHSESGSASGSALKPRPIKPLNKGPKRHSKYNNYASGQNATEPEPDDCQLEALHLVLLLSECTAEMLEESAKWLGAFKGLKNITYMAASSNSRSPPAQPPLPPMPAPALPPPPPQPHPGHSLSPAPFDTTPSTSLTSLVSSTSTSIQPSINPSSPFSPPPVASELDADENIEGSDTNPNEDSNFPSDINANTSDHNTMGTSTDQAADNDDYDHDTDPSPDHILRDPEMTLDEAEIARMWHRACPSLDTIILPMGKVWFKRP